MEPLGAFKSFHHTGSKEKVLGEQVVPAYLVAWRPCSKTQLGIVFLYTKFLNTYSYVAIHKNLKTEAKPSNYRSFPHSRINTAGVTVAVVSCHVLRRV